MLAKQLFRASRMWLFVFTSLTSIAQQAKDSVTLLHEVVIEQSHLGNYAISKYTLRVDSLTRALASGGSVADLLRKHGFGHVRGYGPGGLATTSFRGTGSSHTAVLWNGINLLSPLSGQLDLSLVPVGFIDDASIQTGGAASLYGNGSIGGTILLNNKAAFGEGLKLKTFSNGGSFGSYYQDVGMSWSGKKFISSTKAFLNVAENNFTFLNDNVFPTQIQQRQHTATHQKGILHQNYWQPSANNLFTFKFWWQDNTYEVPNPTSIVGKAEAVERNTFYRAVAGWNYTHQKFDLNYQGAFIRHDLNYSDPASNLVSLSTFNTSINNLEGNFVVDKNSTLTSGINYTWEQGKVDAFAGQTPERNRIAFFSAFKFKPATRWEMSFALREELVNTQTTPLAPTITTKVSVAKGLHIYNTLSRNYRIATFNDLYWKGAGASGNAYLKPEISIGGEVGLQFNYPFATTRKSLTFKTAVFSNDVDNWILWSPNALQIWSPQNIKKVWSRGIEAQATAHKNIRDVGLELSFQYSFTQATSESIYENANINELGKQLMLTPQHEGSITTRIIWMELHINLVNTYTGKQFINSDNSDFYPMQPYIISNFWLSKPFRISRTIFTLTGELNNIFNIAYQSRPGYPMPGRNFKVGVSINFN